MSNTKKLDQKENTGELAELLASQNFLSIPKVGDVVKGRVISVAKNAVRVDIEGFRAGMVRGPELEVEGTDYENLKPTDEVEAVVVDLENENGDVELSFRFAGVQRAWEKLHELLASGVIIPIKITEANKGGLIVRLHNIAGFLPVSQLSPDNYPRVTGGDKQKIFEKLRSLVGKTLNVKVIDVNEADNKLIVSEKSVWEETQRGVIESYKVSDIIEGEVTALADFGAFIKFQPKEGSTENNMLEGLIHISEIAWQRIDHPRDILKIGDKVQAQIISIDGSKIFLSMKNLIGDPWKNISERYKLGQIVKGKILKINPFGFFVELDPEIHGLAHISELADRPVHDLSEVGKIGDEIDWKIISIEPMQHRLGLSLKALHEKVEKNEVVKEPGDEKTKEPTETKKTEEKEEIKQE